MAKERKIELKCAVDAKELDLLAERAALAERRRAHMLLHSGPDDPVQRLIIALQPNTYVRPHRHSKQWELLFLHRGRIDVLHFSKAGELLGRRPLDKGTPIVQIPISEWHGCVVHEPDTVVIEIKPGPYRVNEFADWAPKEGSEQAVEFVRWVSQASLGQKWPRPALGQKWVSD